MSHFLLVVPNVIPPLLIAVPLSPISRLFAFTLYTLATLKALAHTTCTGDPFQDYTLGVLIATLFFNNFVAVWLLDPINRFYHENDTKRPAEMGLVQRVYWATCVCINVRGIGWNYGILRIPPHPALQRWPFVISRLLWVMVYALVAELSRFYLSNHPILAQYRADFPELPSIHLASQGYFNLGHLGLVVAWWGRTYTAFAMHHALASAICVALGVSRPEDWPELMGGDVWSLRQFWCYHWHQLFRRFVQAIGGSLTQAFGLRKGSAASAYTQLYAAFAISALIHAAGDHTAAPTRNPLLASGPFFLVQPLGITIEDSAVRLTRMSGLKVGAVPGRVIGRVWVMLWFSWTLPMLMEGMVHAIDIKPLVTRLV